jgi:copper transport protein
MRRSARSALASSGTAPRLGVVAPPGAVTLLGAAALLAVAAVLAVPPPHVDAHALLRRADPENGATLQRPPEVVTLTFTEAPEPAFSSIRVLDAAGQAVSQGSPQPVAGSPDVLRLPLGALPAGVYTVNWRTVSRIDGHVTGGALAFGVGVAPAETPVSDAGASPPSLFGAAARWLFYAGLIGLTGCAWVWTVVLPDAAAGSWRAPWLAWAAAALGVIGLEEAQRVAAGADFAQFLSTWLGWTMAWRAVLVLSAASALLVGTRMAGPQRRTALIAAGCCASLAVFAHVAAGHAASTTWRWASVAIQWLHASAIGAWIGGLGALLSAVGRTPSDDRAAAVRRFSTGAGILLAVVIATGATRAFQELGAWDRLLTTPYGRLILLKIGLLATLAILGAFNRFRSVPQAAQTLQGLRRIGSGEVAVAALALALTAILTQTAPASFLQDTGALSRVVATGSDFATSMRARLEISPGLPGLNRFALTLSDYDTDDPVVADRVTLRFRSAGRPDLSTSTLTMTRQYLDRIYRAQGTNLSLEGKWIVVAVVETGVSSVEVPLVVTMRGQPQTVRTIEAPGQPTLYSIGLPQGVVLDSYLDPGRPGFNEVHVTFINVGGQELPIPGLAAIVASRGGEGRTSLPVRRFGPGHFIGDATLTEGAWEIEVIAATADGQVLRARFRVRV